MPTIADLEVKFSAETSGLESGTNKAQGLIGSLTSGARGLATVAGGMILGSAVQNVIGNVGQLASAGIDFGRQMANVNSIAQLSGDQLAILSDQVTALAQNPAITQGPAELAAGLYNIYSSGFQGADGLKILEAAGIAATAGMTSSDVAARAITASLNAYGLSADQAGNVSDILFATVDKGVLSFEQLANNLGNTLPLANSLGIGLDELGSAYALMTLKGVSAAQAETQIASLMRSAINPTEALTAAVQAHGYESAEAAIASEGFAGFLKILEEASGGSKEKLADMLGTAEAVNAALILGANDGADYAKMLDDIAGSAGATRQALEKQMESSAFAIQKMKQSIEIAATMIMGAFAPAITAAAQGISRFVLGAMGFVRELKLMHETGGAFIDSWVKKFPGYIQPIIRLLYDLLDPLGDVMDAFQALMKGDFAEVWDELKEAASGFGKAIERFGKTLWKNFTAIDWRKVAISFGRGLSTAIRSMVPRAKSAITSAIQGVANILGTGISSVADWFRDNKDMFGPLSGAADRFGQILGFVGDKVKVFAEVFSRWTNLTNPISAAFMSLGLVLGGIAAQFPVLTNLLAPLSSGLFGIGHAIEDVIDAGQAILRGDFSAAWDSLRSAARNAYDAFRDFGDAAVVALGMAWDALRGVDWGGVWDTITDGASRAWDTLRGWGDDLLRIGRDALRGLYNGLTENWPTIRDWTGKIGSTIADLVTDAGTWLLQKGRDAVTGLYNGLIEKWPTIRDWLSKLGTTVSDLVTGAATWLAQKGRDLITGFGDAITEHWPTVSGWLRDLGTKVKDAVGAASEWLKDKAQFAMAGLTAAFSDNWPTVSTWLSNLGTKIKDAVGNASNWLSGKGADILSGLKKDIEDAVEKIKPDIIAAVKRLFQFDVSANFGEDLGRRFGDWLDGLDWSGMFGKSLDIQNLLMKGFSAVIVGAVGLLAGIVGQVAALIGGFFKGLFESVNWEEAKTTAGEKIKSMLQDASDWAMDHLQTLSDDVGKWLSSKLAGIKTTAAEIGQLGKNIATDIANAIRDKIGEWSGDTILGALRDKLNGLDIGFGTILGLGKKIGDSIAKAIAEMVRGWSGDTVIGAIRDKLEGLSISPDTFTSLGSSLASAIWEGIKAAATNWDWKSLIPDWVPFIDSGGPKTPASSGSGGGGGNVAGMPQLLGAPIPGGGLLSGGLGGVGMSPITGRPDAQARGSYSPAAMDTSGITAFVAAVNSAAASINAATASIGTAFANLGKAVSAGMTLANAAVTTAGAAIRAAMTGMQTAVITALVAMGTATVTGMTAMQNAVQSGAAGMQTKLIAGLVAMTTATLTAMTALGTAITNGMQAARTAVTTATTQMATALSTFATVAGSMGRAAGTSFSSGIQSGMAVAVGAAISGRSQIIGAMTLPSMYGSGYSVGSSLGQGIAAGLWSQVGAVQTAAQALINAAAAAATARGEISSPSRLFRREIGEPLAQGIVAGMLSQRDEVRRAAQSLIPGGFGEQDRFRAYPVDASRTQAPIIIQMLDSRSLLDVLDGAEKGRVVYDQIGPRGREIALGLGYGARR